MPTATESLTPDQVFVLLERVRESDEWRAVAALLRAERRELVKRLVASAEYMSERETAAVAGEIRGINRALAVVQGQDTKQGQEALDG